MEKFISCSGGVESTALCLMFGHAAKGLFADTGFEHRLMYERLDHIEAVIKGMRPGFELVRVRSAGAESTGKTTLPEYIAYRKYYPASFARFCTRLFKIEPIDAYLSSRGRCELMIGLNWDERDAREGNHGLMANVVYSYPLVDLKLTRADCLRVLREHGLEPKFPAYMGRGGCVGCFFKRKSEYASMAVEAPEEFEVVASLEESIQDRRGTFYHIHPDIENLRQFGVTVRERERSQGRLFPLEQAGEMAAPPSSCGVFCHR